MEGVSIPRRRRPSVSVSPPHQQPNPTSACSHPDSPTSNGTMVWRLDATSTSTSGLNPHLPRQACSVNALVPPPLVQAGTAPVEKDFENGAVIAGGALSSLLRVRERDEWGVRGVAGAGTDCFLLLISAGADDSATSASRSAYLESPPEPTLQPSPFEVCLDGVQPLHLF